MKKIIIAILILAPIFCSAQAADTVTVTENPRSIATGDTDETLIIINRGVFVTSHGLPPVFDVIIKAKTTNTGTIKINALGVTTASSTALAAGEHIIIKCRGLFWLVQSASGDGCDLYW